MKIRVVLTAILSLSLLFEEAVARRDADESQRAERRGESGLSTGQAAEVARRKTGGRVLSVKASKGGYQVRVLTPGGEVRHVFVPGRGR